jgi:hypothetical protein
MHPACILGRRCTLLASQSPSGTREAGLANAVDPKHSVAMVDLATMRETLALIRDDLQRVPALQHAAELIGAALADIELAERRRLLPIPCSVLEGRRPARRRH